jgi:threonine aldolase
MDGARLMNAVVASGVSAARYAAGFDTAWIDFSKGLGAPVGAVLAASGELIGEAWRYKQMLGGALRQSGILAAGCLYALEHNVDRLAVDHDNARLLGEGLAAIPGGELAPAAVETNIVIFTVEDAPALVQRVAGEVDVIALDARRVRAVTHLDIGRPEIERALDAVRTALQ